MVAVTPDHIHAFDEDGFFVLEAAVQGAMLDALRRESDHAVSQEAARTPGPSELNVSKFGKRYFAAGYSRTRPVLREFLFGPLMLDICARVLGPDAYLFSELFCVKMPLNTATLAWHQDYAYLDGFGFSHHPPNLSVWTALDDMTESNGALQVLPFSRGGTREVVKHRLDLTWDDKLADFGDHPPEILSMPAGSVVVLSGLLPHHSGADGTERQRRAYLVQYSKQPILEKGRPAQMAVPALRGGVPQTPEYSHATLNGQQ